MLLIYVIYHKEAQELEKVRAHRDSLLWKSMQTAQYDKVRVRSRK